MAIVNGISGSFIFTLLIVTVLAVIWAGCIFATRNNPSYSCLCALLICIPLLYRLGERIMFISQNGGMEGKDGYGSPLAFIIGMFMENAILVPYLILFVYGAIIWRKKYSVSRLTRVAN